MEKRLIYVLSFLTVLQMAANAQTTPENPSRWSIGLSAGPAFPTGHFAHFQNPVAIGDVNSGINAELSGAYHFSSALSATIVADGQLNRGDGIFYSHVPTPNSSAKTYNDRNWLIGRLLAGAVYSVPLQKNEKLKLFVRGLGGIQKTRAADYHRTLSVSGPQFEPPLPTVISTPGVSFPWTFSYQADAGLQWKLHGRLSMMAYAGFNGCKPSRSFDYDVPSTNGTTMQIYTVKAAFPTSTVHAGVGIDYSL